MKIKQKLIKIALVVLLGGTVLGALGVVGLYFYIKPSLPSIDSLKDVRFQVPLRIYSADGALIGEFGEKRREPLKYEEIPQAMVRAVLSAEDDRFFEHPGVDYQGILRAIAVLITTGQKVQGGSTITMQVARNFFLSFEKTYLRKFSEILLALKIENELSKEEILELYFNKIYFGNRAYGVAAAANVYYGKDIRELNLAQLAMIAGLPKAPSRFNPVVNPERALQRRNYVLRRMRDLGYIDNDTYSRAAAEGVTASLHSLSAEVDAPYVAEMVRAEMAERYGNDIYTAGYNVYTTIDSRLQQAANEALRTGLLDYDSRHGYRGAEQQVDLLEQSSQEDWETLLGNVAQAADLEPGVVISVDDQEAAVYMKGGRVAWLCWQGLSWAAPYRDGNRTGPAPQAASDVVHEGDVVRLRKNAKGIWALSQIPEVEGALVSLRPKDGAIRSIIGGFDFYRSKFNRAIQARRQPGSNFKPFVYSAALEKGFTAASLINDAPVVFNDPGLEDTWRPENYSGRFFGPTRLRQALVKSRNLVSIRLLRSIGVGYAINYVQRFGFDPQYLPRDLSLALGSATFAPLDIARGYAVFANGGYLVKPYLISRIENVDGDVLMEADPVTACPECEAQQQAKDQPPQAMTTAVQDDASSQPTMETAALPEEKPVNAAKRVVDARNVYIMTSFMREVIRRGTGRRALQLHRNDLAGKTGTTNDQRDAWFSGFNSDVVTTAWVGFDKPHPLGDRETGAGAALPAWIAYMAEALKGVPERPLVQPPGLVTVRIDPETGLLAGADFPKAIFEVFREEYAPKQMAEVKTQSGQNGESGAVNIPETLF